MIDPDCVCIYVWLAAAGGKGTEWTRPASQPGYTTQGTEQIVQQNRRWVVSFHENDALIFDCWMLCPHSCIWPCQSVKKTYISQSAHCIVDFENFDVGRVHTRLRTSQKRLRQVQGAQPFATTFDMAVSAREVQSHFCNYSHWQNWLDGISERDLWLVIRSWSCPVSSC